MMVKAREIADDHPSINVTVFHPAFIYYDQYIAVWPNMRQNMLIATAAMFVVSLLLIPHPICSLWVTFSIVSFCTGVIGYMTWWGVNIDTISMINIIMCIGFCVDFSAHITYAFVSAGGDTGNERMRRGHCRRSLGWWPWVSLRPIYSVHSSRRCSWSFMGPKSARHHRTVSPVAEPEIATVINGGEGRSCADMENHETASGTDGR